MSRRMLPAVCFLLFVLSTQALAERVQLSNGDSLEVEVLSRDGDALLVRHAVLGELRLNADQWQPEPPVAAASPVSPWAYELELGLNGNEGNTENNAFKLAARATYREAEETHKFDLSYDQASDNGTRSANRGALGWEWQSKLNWQGWSRIVRSRVELDEFQSWDQRLSASLGLSRSLVLRDDLQLALEAGAGGRYESGGGESGVSPELLLGSALDWTPSERHAVNASSRLLQNLREPHGFRWINAVKWDWKPSVEAKDFALRLSVENEYESEPDPGERGDDTRYGLSLVWKH